MLRVSLWLILCAFCLACEPQEPGVVLDHAPAPVTSAEAVSDLTAGSTDQDPADALPLAEEADGTVVSAGELATNDSGQGGSAAAGGQLSPSIEDAGGSEMGGLPAMGGSDDLVSTGGSDQPEDAPRVPGCVLPDGSVALTTTPTHEQTAVAFDGVDGYLVWADDDGVHLCKIASDGDFIGERVFIESPDVPITTVRSIRINGVPWVAYGGTGQPIRLFQPHRVFETLFVLATGDGFIFGPPILTEAGGELIVMGQTLDGLLSIQTVPNDLSSPPPGVIRDFGLPLPDEAGATEHGIILKFNTLGQCVFLEPQGWELFGNLPCSGNLSSLLSDGSRALTWSVENDQYVQLKSLYDRDALINIGGYDVPSSLAFADYMGLKPMLGRRLPIEPESRRGDVQLYLAGVNTMWESSDTWSAGGWPYSDARGVLYFRLPGAVREGLCSETGEACLADDACMPAVTEDGGSNIAQQCDGAAPGDDTALVFRFVSDLGPVIEKIPLVKRDFSTSSDLYAPDPLCSPRPEVCDGVDNDCDCEVGEIGCPFGVDEGLCCHDGVNGNDLSLDFGTITPPDQWLVTEHSNGSAFMVVHRMEDEVGKYWRIVYVRGLDDDIYFSYSTDCNLPGYDCEAEDLEAPILYRYAGDARGYTVVGRLHALIARQNYSDSPELPTNWGIYWMKSDRRLKPGDYSGNPVPLPHECDSILAYHGLDGSDERESVVIVCPDRIIRAYASPDIPDQEWLFSSSELGGLQGGIEWATIRPSIVQSGGYNRPDIEFQLLVAYRSVTSSRLNLDRYLFTSAMTGAPIALAAGDIFQGLSDSDIQSPIHLHVEESGPPIRLSPEGRLEALFADYTESEVTKEWQVLTTDRRAARYDYSILNHMLMTTGAVDENGQTAQAFWAMDTLSQGGRYNLWSRNPTYIETEPLVTWRLAQTPFYKNRNLVTVTRANESGTEWRVNLIDIECREP